MLPALFDRAELKPVRLAIGDPALRRLRESDAGAGRCMRALRDLMQRRHLPSVRLLLRGEGLEPALASLVEIVNDPRAFFAAVDLPSPLPDARHLCPPLNSLPCR